MRFNRDVQKGKDTPMEGIEMTPKKPLVVSANNKHMLRPFARASYRNDHGGEYDFLCSQHQKRHRLSVFCLAAPEEQL